MKSTYFSSAANQKLILFNISAQHSFCLAVPIHQVYKVISQAHIYGSGRTPIGLTHLDDHEVTVIDLHRHFYRQPQPEVSHLMILQGSKELLGIPLQSAPLLIEVPTERIRVLPARYRQIDILGLAHYVVKASTEDGEELNAFILDQEALESLSVQNTLQVWEEEHSSLIHHRPDS